MAKMRGKKPYKTKKKTNNKMVKVNNSNYFIFSFFFPVITLHVNAHQKRFAEWGKNKIFFHPPPIRLFLDLRTCKS